MAAGGGFRGVAGSNVLSAPATLRRKLFVRAAALPARANRGAVTDARRPPAAREDEDRAQGFAAAARPAVPGDGTRARARARRRAPRRGRRHRFRRTADPASARFRRVVLLPRPNRRAARAARAPGRLGRAPRRRRGARHALTDRRGGGGDRRQCRMAALGCLIEFGWRAIMKASALGVVRAGTETVDAITARPPNLTASCPPRPDTEARGARRPPRQACGGQVFSREATPSGSAGACRAYEEIEPPIL